MTGKTEDEATQSGNDTDADRYFTKIDLVRFGGRATGCVEAANQILSGVWPLAGQGLVKLGFPPDWESSEFHRPAGDKGKMSLRLCWELNRCHAVVWLARAYEQTGEARYAEGTAKLISDWAEKHPVGQGIQWVCPMEAALRAMNWIAAASLLVPGDALDKRWWKELCVSLMQHGAYIVRNLEFGFPRNGNHLLANLAGLVYISHAAPWCSESAEWREIGLNGILRELQDQIERDGSQCEGSPSYHAVVCELVAWPLLLATAHGWRMTRDVAETITRMFDYLEAVLDNRGRPPNIADGDSSHVHEFQGPELDPEKRADARPIVELGESLLKEHGFSRAGRRTSDVEAETGKRDSGPSVSHFPDAGLAIASCGPWRLVCSLGASRPVGRFTHRHNDLLSFELSADGNPLVVDSGSYLYTPEIETRNYFRGTLAHSTLAIDDQEQHVLGRDPFVLDEYHGSRLLQCGSSPKGTFIEAEHSSYKRLRGGPVHRRRWDLHSEPATVAITDTILGSGRHELTWSYPLSTSCSVIEPAGRHLAITHDDGFDCVLSWSVDGLSPKVTEGWWSRIYGDRKPIPVARFALGAGLPLTITWKLALKPET